MLSSPKKESKTKESVRAKAVVKEELMRKWLYYLPYQFSRFESAYLVQSHVHVSQTCCKHYHFKTRKFQLQWFMQLLYYSFENGNKRQVEMQLFLWKRLYKQSIISSMKKLVRKSFSSRVFSPKEKKERKTREWVRVTAGVTEELMRKNHECLRCSNWWGKKSRNDTWQCETPATTRESLSLCPFLLLSLAQSLTRFLVLYGRCSLSFSQSISCSRSRLYSLEVEVEKRPWLGNQKKCA